MKNLLKILLSIFSFITFAVAQAPDRIFYNGTVLTLNEANYIGEAVAVKDGKILRVGKNKDLFKLRHKKTELTDLKGKTIMPGFIDAHGHMGDYIFAWKKPNLASPPAGPVKSISDIIHILKQDIADRKPTGDELILGINYDDSLLKERRHPDRVDLDQISKTHMVCVWHVSGHLASCNSKVLAKLGFNKDTPDPDGGVIRKDKSGLPTGVMEEHAVFAVLKFLPQKSFEQMSKDFNEIQDYYAKNGITTGNDGMTSLATFEFLKKMASKKELRLDIVSYPKWDEFDKIISQAKLGEYENHFKLGGVKITQDGSPQGKTAYLSQPYLKPPLTQTKDYRGYPAFIQEELDAKIDNFFKHDVQVNVHCNGDACIDMLLKSFEKGIEKYGMKDRRAVIVHAQTIRTDQLAKIKAMGVFPTFFPAHTFYWGDWHRLETLGEERARRISPLMEAESFGIKYSIHNDTPVVPVELLPAVWSATNRITRSHFVLGPEQRVSTLSALKAITSWAAYQYFEENSKGTLEPGKLADMVVLSQNPLRLNPKDLKSIKVLETIKEGETIFKLISPRISSNK